MSAFGEFDGEPIPRFPRWLIVPVLLLLISAVAFLMTTEPGGDGGFCQLSLSVRELVLDTNEVTTAALVPLEDQGSPGRDHCDIDPAGYQDGPVLGFDCKVREGGATIGTADASRADGTCGQSGR